MAELRPEQLPRQLSAGLAPVYLLTGDEPLLVEESLSQIREAARAAGFDEREVLQVEAGFDWGRLREAARSLSLFSSRRLVELRCPDGKVGRDGGAALKEYAGDPPADTLLVVAAAGIDARQRSSAWVKALAGAGVHVHAWPVAAGQLPGWLARRLRARGLEADEEALALLAERAEGNLLAAAQEVDKLSLLYDGGRIGAAEVREAVGDSARFVTFDLPRAVAAGDLARVWRITDGLREEDDEPVLVLGVLARMLRVLLELRAAHASRRESPDAVFRRHRIRKAEQRPLWQLAGAVPASRWQALLVDAARVDRVIKGAARGRPWDELLHLASEMTRLAAGAGRAGARSG
ncbi:DNA polymerase III subunit delta [wastewater metagenome]|uniref:DNA polymerase III subunit delta n=3 Tax=root TaxID=1 RepID=A0A5B8R931_9ZZZZ|nr:DNA polymerase III subunit delta [Arhodomonas aquaeolei]MCS4505003.1 DNA polymerase III subunit delta [Arhodomonas aquaeolei]QEA05230.1 DNA polymerase III subunit delta [uncultured organism]